MKHFSYTCDTDRVFPIGISFYLGGETVSWWITLILRIPKCRARVFTLYHNKVKS